MMKSRGGGVVSRPDLETDGTSTASRGGKENGTCQKDGGSGWTSGTASVQDQPHCSGERQKRFHPRGVEGRKKEGGGRGREERVRTRDRP